MVKNLPANAGAAGDSGSIPESGRSPKITWQHSSFLAWTKGALVGPQSLGTSGLHASTGESEGSAVTSAGLCVVTYSSGRREAVRRGEMTGSPSRVPW